MRGISTWKKLGVVLATLGAAVALAGAALAGNGPQKTIWVCHFAGNTAPQSWTINEPGVGNVTLTGDYILNYVTDGPTSNQTQYCSDHGGLGVISIAAAAAENGNGHKTIQLLDRIAAYPDH